MPESNPTPDQLAAAMTAETTHQLAEALAKIKHCVAQLSEEQVWWRQIESHNSIGNLILHLCGNVRQWIIAGVGGAKDIRNRPQEFAERGPIPKADLIARLDQTVREANVVLSNVSASDLLRIRRIQGSDVTALQAIFDSLPHFRGHSQEIIHITRHLLGAAYQFKWKPLTPEQGAPVP